MRSLPSGPQTHLVPTIAEPRVAIPIAGVIARTARKAWRDDAIQARRVVRLAMTGIPSLESGILQGFTRRAAETPRRATEALTVPTAVWWRGDRVASRSNKSCSVALRASLRGPPCEIFLHPHAPSERLPHYPLSLSRWSQSRSRRHRKDRERSVAGRGDPGPVHGAARLDRHAAYRRLAMTGTPFRAPLSLGTRGVPH